MHPAADDDPHDKNDKSKRFVLLLGEGNFSFGASLSTALKDQDQDASVIATDLNKEFPSSSDSSKGDMEHNISLIKDNGGLVFLDVDATRLEEHRKLREEYSSQISKIIFNFPHVKTKKMHIGKNRDLLRDFFKAAGTFISLNSDLREVEVCVSLCKGQSGIPEVEGDSTRKWEDTWQILEMAASAGFVLKGHHKFEDFWVTLSPQKDLKVQETYRSYGYRNRGSQFRWGDGNTFIFKLSLPPPLITPHLLQDLPQSLNQLEQEWTSELQGFNDKHPLHTLCNQFGSSIHNLRVRFNFSCDRDKDFFKDYGFFDICELIIIIEDKTKILSNKTAQHESVQNEILSKFLKLELSGNHDLWIISLSNFLIREIPNFDWRMLLSPHCRFKGPPEEDRDFLREIRTNSLYPRVYVNHVSFWVGVPNCDCNCDKVKVLSPENVRKCAVLIIGNKLRGIQLLEIYKPSEESNVVFGNCEICKLRFTTESHLYKISIQSVDEGVDKVGALKVLDDLRDKLGRNFMCVPR